MDKLTLYSKGVEIAEAKPGEDIHAKFCLCDFGTNQNGTRLNRDTIDRWMSTIINQPLVGRIRGNDFTGHNMRVVQKIDENGNIEKKAEFDTDAFGVFTSCAIENINDVEVITANCDIWARFENVCELIKKRFSEGTLHTSWEIAVGEAHVDEVGDKVIDMGRFTGLCVLGAKVPPAYDSSMMIEAAEADHGDDELVSAFKSDIASESKENVMKDFEISTEDIELSKCDVDEAKISESAENQDQDQEQPEQEVSSGASEHNEDENEQEDKVVDDETDAGAEDEIETSALTVHDIIEKICEVLAHERQYMCEVFPEEHIVWAKCWEETMNTLDYIQYTYAIDGNQIILSEPAMITLTVSPMEINTAISEKVDAIVLANEKIQNLEAEVEELKPYKDAAEKANRDAEISRLMDIAQKSGMFNPEDLESGDVATIISELDETKLKLCIAERYMERQAKPQNREVDVASAEKVERNLYSEDDTYTSLLNAYINKK